MGANQQYLKLAKSLSKMIRGFANLIQHGFVLLAYMAVLFLITLPGALVVTLCFIVVSLGLGRLIPESFGHMKSVQGGATKYLRPNLGLASDRWRANDEPSSRSSEVAFSLQDPVSV